MKKKLLVLLVAAMPALFPSLASAVAVDVSTFIVSSMADSES